MSYNEGRRAKELPSNWMSLRSQILRRDGFTCRWITDGVRCTVRASEVDHIQRGSNHDPSNLQSLCKSHHATKTAYEAIEAREAKKASTFAAYGRQKETRF